MEKDSKDLMGVTFNGNVTFNGPMFDIHDNQHVHIYNKTKDADSDSPTTEEAEEVVEKLKPIFYNNEADVRLFLKEISGMQPNNITDLVNRWVQEKRISDYGNSRKGELWEILNDAGLYTKSRQNWCRRVY